MGTGRQGRAQRVRDAGVSVVDQGKYRLDCSGELRIVPCPTYQGCKLVMVRDPNVAFRSGLEGKIRVVIPEYLEEVLEVGNLLFGGKLSP